MEHLRAAATRDPPEQTEPCELLSQADSGQRCQWVAVCRPCSHARLNIVRAGEASHWLSRCQQHCCSAAPSDPHTLAHSGPLTPHGPLLVAVSSSAMRLSRVFETATVPVLCLQKVLDFGAARNNTRHLRALLPAAVHDFRSLHTAVKHALKRNYGAEVWSRRAQRV